MKEKKLSKWNDVHFEAITNDKIKCKDCAHGVDSIVDRCHKYPEIKPKAVFDGLDCEHYKKK